MARSLTTQDVTWFLDLQKKGQLNLNPPYQRRSVWSPKDKRFFIDTVLNNYPAPPVFLHKSLDDNGTATYHVVDGKQRIQTIIDFTLGKIKIPDDFAELPLQGKRWKELERATRERFWNYVLIVEILPDVSDASVRNIFERINRNSRKLMPQELRHAKYDGWFVSTAEAEAEKQEWKDFGVVTTARSKRMADAQFISELMAVLINKAVIGFDQDTLDDLYAEYEDLVDHPELLEDDFNQAIEDAKKYLAAMLVKAPDILQYFKIQTHLYSLWTYLVLQKEALPAADVFAESYTTFMAMVLEVMAESQVQQGANDTALGQASVLYAASSRGASTELPQRKARYDAMLLAFQGIEAAPVENS